jgi:undecaprenyl pyrophosphate phosphatase UppP
LNPFPKGNDNGKHAKNWMYGMGILFIVMATVIALRNFYLYSTNLSVGFYFDNYTSNSVTNEKFVIAMLIGGGILLYWGKFRKTRNPNNLDDDSRNFN